MLIELAVSRLFSMLMVIANGSFHYETHGYWTEIVSGDFTIYYLLN